MSGCGDGGWRGLSSALSSADRISSKQGGGLRDEEKALLAELGPDGLSLRGPLKRRRSCHDEPYRPHRSRQPARRRA